MRRREILKVMGAASSIMLAPRAFAIEDSDPIKDLSVVIQRGGKEQVYAASAGKDLGDFKTSRFVQRCVRVDQAGSPLTIFFRPDRNNDRIEVVFELGRMWGKANQDGDHWGAYRAIIRNGSKEIATIDAPRHWWFSRWRWQSKPRPIVRTGRSLIDARLMLPYAESAARFAEEPESSERTVYRAPMDTANVLTAVGSAGERYDYGPVTEYQAHYLIAGSDRSLATLRAQAEAAASMPMHIRDEKTHAPVNFFQYPALDWKDNQSGDPWVKGNDSLRDASGERTCEWNLSTGHDPALNYLPYLLTEDPYHLEELQFQGNQTLGWMSYHRSQNQLQIVYPGEARSYAWSIRTMFQLATVTPETTPQWLLPRAHWKRIVDDNLEWFTKHFVDNPSPACAVFSAGPRVDDIGGWQEDFLATCLGWGVLLGHEEWRKAYSWKLKSTLARSNGKSGWPRQWCVPYYFAISKEPPQDMTYTAKSSAGIWFKSWGEAWDAFRANANNNVTEPFPDKTSWAQANSNDFIVYPRGVLALATHLDVAEAREPYEFVNQMVNGVKFMHNKWAIAPK